MRRLAAIPLAFLMLSTGASLGEDWSNTPMYDLAETRKAEKIVNDMQLDGRIVVDGVFPVPQVFGRDVGSTDGCVYGEYGASTVEELCPLGNSAYVLFYEVEAAELGKPTHYRVAVYDGDLNQAVTHSSEDPFDGLDFEISSDCVREGWTLSRIGEDGIIEFSQSNAVEQGDASCPFNSELGKTKRFVVEMSETWFLVTRLSR